MPGISAPVNAPGLGEWTSAVGSMNHIAFNVPEEKFLEYRDKLVNKGVTVSPILDHDESEAGVARELHPGRVRPLVLLPGPGRHRAGVRLLAAGDGPAR